VKKCKYDHDFESIKPSINVSTIDMIIKFKVKMITSPPFRNKLRLDDVIMAKYQVPRWFLKLMWI